ncbi:transposase [Acidovorax sp. SRB_24]|uniref:transposase n=1 Tax=Acidovorax sp. SRB_24 TaxID=1962700 RepID=UPI00145EFDF6|nr:hypothetical protein [Acidovorax sp. SRB_24]
MYSYEDRIRVVELYIKLGKRVRPTNRQLGYPTKNALKGWCREYEQWLDLPVGYLPSYSPELNPEERLNADLKQEMGKRVPIRTKAKLREAANDHTAMSENSPERVMGHF